MPKYVQNTAKQNPVHLGNLVSAFPICIEVQKEKFWNDLIKFKKGKNNILDERIRVREIKKCVQLV